jgi:hypothetical protein
MFLFSPLGTERQTDSKIPTLQENANLRFIGEFLHTFRCVGADAFIKPSFQDEVYWYHSSSDRFTLRSAQYELAVTV